MQQVSDMRILEHIGLTRNESFVYIQLLKSGSALAKDVSRNINMHRTSVYACLNRLHKKGLVSVTSSSKKTFFEAVDPSKLMSLLKEREERLLKVLPELKNLKDTTFYTKHEVQYFKGKQGLKTIFDDIISTGANYIGWGPEKKIEKILKYYFIHYINARKEKSIHAKMIYFEDSKGMEYTKNPLVKARFLPKAFYSPTALRVYGDNVAIILLEDDPLCILIRNKAIAESYRKHFNILWSMARK